ncbi:MAG: hypothetical protein AAGA08_12925 [Pseudomonadota bacterium]
MPSSTQPDPDWPEPIRHRAAASAARFQHMMQRPGSATHLPSARFAVIFILFVSLFPLGMTLGVNYLVCHANLGGAADLARLGAVCGNEKAAVDPTITDAESGQESDGSSASEEQERQAAQTAEKTLLTHQNEALIAIEGWTPTTLQEITGKLDAIVSIKQAQEAARLEAFEEQMGAERKAAEDADAEDVLEYENYRSIVIFMSMAVAYCAWALFTFTAQTSVINRLWVASYLKKDSAWSVSDVVTARPGIVSLLFGAGLIVTFALIEFERYFSLPGFFGRIQYPVPWLWMSVATLASTTICITAIGVRCLVYNYPAPLVAHAWKIKTSALIRDMEKHIKAQSDKTSWPKKIDHLDVLLLGVDPANTAPDPKARKLLREPIRLPKVAKSASPDGILSAINTLCVFLIALMVATLIFVSVGFDVLEGKVRETEALESAIIASGDAWVLVLGVGMSVSVFMIYAFAAARIVPYCGGAEGGADDKKLGWNLTGNAWTLFGASGNVSLEAKPIEKNKAPERVDPDVAYYLGGNQSKLERIIAGCENGAGFHATFSGDMLKKLTSLLGLLTPAAVGTLLTFLG